jgi:endonuclease-3 related protein
VALGSILTQNTTFISVQKSLSKLENLGAISSHAIKNLPIDVLKAAIRPSGYFNQKTNYILEFIDFFEDLNGRIPTREELLKVKGIGEETADSILLYGYAQDQFKVDAYTKRILLHVGFIEERAKYSEIKTLLENSLKPLIEEKKERVIIYQEFHSLFVAHGKNFYSKKPYGVNEFL